MSKQLVRLLRNEDPEPEAGLPISPNRVGWKAWIDITY